VGAVSARSVTNSLTSLAQRRDSNDLYFFLGTSVDQGSS